MPSDESVEVDGRDEPSGVVTALVPAQPSQPADADPNVTGATGSSSAADLDTSQRAVAAPATPVSENGAIGPVAPPRRRRWLLVLAVAGSVVAAGAAAWLLRPQTDAHYLRALKVAQVAHDYPNDDAAVAHAKAFCRSLAGGHEAQGYESERIAVRYYCGSFLPGFTVIPTPAEQQARYLQALRDGGHGGEFPSDAAAVAHATSVCDGLKRGGKQQGLPVDLIGVSTYCPEFENGFHVLQTINVRGSFTLRDSYPGYFPSITTYDGGCDGTGGYRDISAGTDVIVKNGDGRTLARTQLGQGEGGIAACEFPFRVKLTEGEDDYVVTVGRRGEVHFTFAQLQNDGMTLTLGD